MSTTKEMIQALIKEVLDEQQEESVLLENPVLTKEAYEPPNETNRGTEISELEEKLYDVMDELSRASLQYHKLNGANETEAKAEVFETLQAFVDTYVGDEVGRNLGAAAEEAFEED